MLNAANEIAVAAFLRNEIGFMDIPAIVERSIEQFCRGTDFKNSPDGIDAVLVLDGAARETANRLLKAL